MRLSLLGIAESSVDDINLMVVYALKEKLKIRDSSSTLPDLDDMAFLRDLKLIVEENGQIRLTTVVANVKLNLFD